MLKSSDQRLNTRRRCSSLVLTAFLALGLIHLAFLHAQAQTTRLIVVKVDGLSYETVDRFVRERNPRTGKSQLPWFEHIFYERGSRLANFYVRGMSLSGPSWSMLDTGQHLQIKGNVEFDRYTLSTYNYLNFFPYMLKGAKKQRVDTPGVEVLDSVGIPLLIDSYAPFNRLPGLSLYQRGLRFRTFSNGFLAHFNRSPKEVFDEWTMGINLAEYPEEGMLQELTNRLNDPRYQYLGMFCQNFDHAAHSNSDRESQLAALKLIDDRLGKIWTAIEKSPLAAETALVIVSDHGMNSEEQVYSQGYNIVKFLGSPAGGGHHVGTQRRLMLDYSIKGIDPFVPLIITSTRDSFYLKGQSSDYPTALLDFDGNERASIHLRDSDLNVLQILLEQIQNKETEPGIRSAARGAFFQVLDQRRKGWQQLVDSLSEELTMLRQSIIKQRELWAAQPKDFSRADEISGRADESFRVFSQLDRWSDTERDYTEYLRGLTNLLSLNREPVTLDRVKIESVIPRRSMGERNTIHQLQNYVVALAPAGLQTKADGTLDLEKSFQRLNYFSVFSGLSVRNNVQAQLSNHPVDFIATRLPSQLVARSLNETSGLTPDAVWIYGGEDRQAIILARQNPNGLYSLRFQPISGLKQRPDGQIEFKVVPWQPGLPLKLFEDPKLAIPENEREGWLSQWHTDEDWLRATHRTQYSNGVIGLYEELGRHPVAGLALDDPEISDQERLRRRFVDDQRCAVEADFMIVANNHWNFDVRGFNPGGNHGSFFRSSTHSTWMMAGGEATGIPRGQVIDEPYDSLSFVPTLLALTGRLRDDMSPVPVLWDKGFRRFPGKLVHEILTSAPIPRTAEEGKTTR